MSAVANVRAVGIAEDEAGDDMGEVVSRGPLDLCWEHSQSSPTCDEMSSSSAASNQTPPRVKVLHHHH